MRYFDGLLSATIGKIGIGLFIAKEFKVDDSSREVDELAEALWKKQPAENDDIVDERGEEIVRAINDIKAAALLKDNARVFALCDSVLEILTPEAVVAEEKLPE